jgi:septum formation protein
MTNASAAAPSNAADGLILASGSPRRRDLLTRAGVRFEIRPADIPERREPGEAPAAFAERLAREKALHVARAAGPEPTRWVLGADTIVVIDEDVLGKPEDEAHAVALLSRLAGRTHVVITAVALVETGRLEPRSTTVASRVTLRAAPRDEIEAYVAGREPMDKAGAYALQGEGRRFVERVEGSESNVIGLPVDETLALLAASGWRA